MRSKAERRGLTKSRAEAFFIEYYEMGPERNLEKLHERVSMMGLKRSLNTLKRYSADFGWQQRVVELDEKFKAEHERAARAKIDKMNESQALDARNMRAIARAGMLSLSNAIKEKGFLNLSAPDIVKFMEAGTKIERLAMGDVTDRVASYDFAYNVMLLGIAEIFRDVNDIRSPSKRMEEFARRVDLFRETKLIEIGGNDRG